MEEFKTVRELYEAYFYGDHLVLDSIDNVELEGWIRTNRDSGSIGFIEFNDGTYFKRTLCSRRRYFLYYLYFWKYREAKRSFDYLQ